MPYKSVAELPPPVKDNIPAEAQKIFMAAYNSAWEQHGKEDNAEMTCTKIAWGAVKTKFKQSGDKWVAKESAKDTLQTKYSELIQEIGRKHAAADEARIKQIINICEECQGNEDDGIIPVDQEFSSGDQHPPAHPRCSCSLSPAQLPESD